MYEGHTFEFAHRRRAACNCVTFDISQPALSQQIAELEARLGVTVLQRHARGVRPTPAGEVLYRQAVNITVEVGMSSILAAALGGSENGGESISRSHKRAPMAP